MECVICLEPIDETTGHLRLPCSHAFHIECALRWLRSNQTCPCCRTDYNAMPRGGGDSAINSRMSALDYDEILTETMRIIGRPWTILDAPQEMWEMLDPDSQRRQIRIWLVEHLRHVFEREFRLLLTANEVGANANEVDWGANANEVDWGANANDVGIVSDGPIDSDHAVLFMIGAGVCCLLSIHVYTISIYLWTYVNG